MIFSIKNRIFHKQTWDLRGSPYCTHNRLKRGFPWFVCTFVGRKNLIHKVILQNIFTFTCSCFSVKLQASSWNCCSFFRNRNFQNPKIFQNYYSPFWKHAYIFWDDFDWFAMCFLYVKYAQKYVSPSLQLFFTVQVRTKYASPSLQLFHVTSVFCF